MLSFSSRKNTVPPEQTASKCHDQRTWWNDVDLFSVAGFMRFQARTNSRMDTTRDTPNLTNTGAKKRSQAYKQIRHAWSGETVQSQTTTHEEMNSLFRFYTGYFLSSEWYWVVWEQTAIIFSCSLFIISSWKIILPRKAQILGS